MVFWTQEQDDKFIVIEKAFEEFCEADPKLSKLDSTNPGPKSEKFNEWYKQFDPAHDAAIERFVKLFCEKILVAIVLHDDKELVLPPEYWASPLASLTFTKGKVQGLLLDDPNRHLENSPVVLRRVDWEKWINDATPDSQHRRQKAKSLKARRHPRGRKKGSGSLAAKDEPLLELMKPLIAGGKSYWPTAMEVAPQAAGAGTVESRAKRLVVRFKEWEQEHSV